MTSASGTPSKSDISFSQLRLVSSPGESYARELLDALQTATRFVLVTGFASVAGVALVAPAIRALLARGGQGRIVIAVDRQGFNAAAVFEALLALKEQGGARLSLGIVLEGAGLLHAKALSTEGPTGERLLVGSANLTRSALGNNHELGLLVSSPPAELRQAFMRFVNSIAPRSLDTIDARAFLESRGLLASKPPVRFKATEPPADAPPIGQVIGQLPPAPPLDEPPDQHVAAWIGQGYLVGRGRRALDALVLRLPHEQLARLGHIRPPKKEVLGIASHETRTMGYGVDLLPTSEADLLRRSARKVTLLLAKLTLNLPCFGHWMPENYWDVFLAARQKLQGAAALDPDAVRERATRHREYLDSGGLEREVDQILRRLSELDLLVPDRLTTLRALLLTRFREQLNLRTPDVIANAIEFRTARQRWAPYEQTEAPFRQLLVDIMQATFAATYRTGDWPRRFRSHAARRLADAVEARLASIGVLPDGENATNLLDRAATWESGDRPFPEVVAEFRSLVGDNLEFQPPDIDTLTASVSDESAEDDEGKDEP